MAYLWRFLKFPESVSDPRYMRILIYLRNNGPCSSRELAETLGLGYGYTRRALQVLRRMGAVEVFLRPSRGLEDFGED